MAIRTVISTSNRVRYLGSALGYWGFGFILVAVGATLETLWKGLFGSANLVHSLNQLSLNQITNVLIGLALCAFGDALRLISEIRNNLDAISQGNASR